MRLRILYTLLLLTAVLYASAQPKWFKKARKAQINLITYDTKDQLLHATNGFFIDNQGTALTDYHSFRGAARAVAIDEAGKEWPVSCIAGASSLYDVLKIKVNIPKNSALPIANTHATKGQEIHVMPYLSNKAGLTTPAPISDISTFNGDYNYYTLLIQLNEKSASCPVMNQEGEVLALAQMPANPADAKSYAVSAAYAQSLATNALSASDSDYRDILIRKALPADPTQAHSFIFLLGTRDTATYATYVDDYITLFPSEPNGYTMKADLLTAQGRYAEAEATWDTGIRVTGKEDELRYARAAAIFNLAQATNKMPEGWTLERAMQDAKAAQSINNQPLYAALVAQLLYAQKQYAEACKHFLALNHTNFRSADNFLYAAQCQQMLRDTTAVLALQDSAVACFTKPYVKAAAPALLMRANTLISLQRYREAVIDLNDYEHLKSKDLTANFYYQREQAEMRCRMYKQALSDMEQATRMEPAEPLFQAELAAINYRFGQFEEAIAAARTAIALDSQFADAYRILGLSLRGQGKEQEARSALQQAIDLGDEVASQLLTP